MKQLLQQYASFNNWANQRLVECVSMLNEEDLHKLTGGSFTSIFKTVIHLWEAEAIWWQRLKLAEHVINPADTFQGNFTDLSQRLLKQSADWEDWVKKAGEAALSHVFAYQNSKREQLKQPVSDVLIHIFNHQSYHRGQAVFQLRILGIDKIPSTDFMQFTRRKI